MPDLLGTVVIAPITPTSTEDRYPTHSAEYGKGSYRTVSTLADRDSISEERRELGMLVWVDSEKQLFRLTTGTTNSDWENLGNGASIPKRKVPFENTSIITIYDVKDYQLINIWIDNPIYRPSLFNETLFGTQLFNQMNSAGAKKYFDYDVLYDIEEETLVIELPENKSGVVTII